MKNKLWKILTTQTPVKLGGYYIKIKYPHIFKERNDANGVFIPEQMTILVTNRDSTGNNIPKSVILQIFVHEIYHAICYIYAGNHTLIDEPNHDAVAQGWHQLFIDN